jgi:hypothetical protein
MTNPLTPERVADLEHFMGHVVSAGGHNGAQSRRCCETLLALIADWRRLREQISNAEKLLKLRERLEGKIVALEGVAVFLREREAAQSWGSHSSSELNNAEEFCEALLVRVQAQLAALEKELVK